MQTLFDDLPENPDFIAIVVLCLALGILGSRLATVDFCCQWLNDSMIQ